MSLAGGSTGSRFSPYQAASEMALHSLFKKYDANHDGTLNESEFHNLLVDDLGLTSDAVEIYQYLLDKNGDGAVSYDELKIWFHSEENLVNVSNDSRFEIPFFTF